MCKSSAPVWALHSYDVSSYVKFPLLLHLCWVPLRTSHMIKKDLCHTWHFELLELLASHKIHVSTTIKITKRKSLAQVSTGAEILQPGEHRINGKLWAHSINVQRVNKLTQVVPFWRWGDTARRSKWFTRHLWGAGKDKPRILTRDSRLISTTQWSQDVSRQHQEPETATLSRLKHEYPSLESKQTNHDFSSEIALEIQSERLQLSRWTNEFESEGGSAILSQNVSQMPQVVPGPYPFRGHDRGA